MVHIGKKIEEIVRNKRIPIVEFSKKINTTRNNTYNIFQRDSIDTELLRKIGEFLEFDFFSYLSRFQSSKLDKQEIISIIAEKKAEYSLLNKESLITKLEKLEKENTQLKERIKDKEEIIKLLRFQKTN